MKWMTGPIQEIGQIQDLVKSVDWDPRTEEEWNEVMKNSSQVYSIWDGSRLIAMGRTVSDGRYSMIFDLVVHRQYQRKGIGKKVLENLLENVRETSAVLLFIDEDGNNEWFYKKFGFAPMKSMSLTKE